MDKKRWSLIEKIFNRLVSFQNILVQNYLIFFTEKISEKSIRLGTIYGGWWVPKKILQESQDWCVISCGLGEDISFDKEIANYGISNLGIESELYFVNVILSARKQEFMRILHRKVGPAFDEIDLDEMCSIANQEFGGRKIVLKMDIEGSEIDILDQDDLLSQKINVLMFELDYLSLVPFVSFQERLKRIKECKVIFNKLTNKGFMLYKKENWNFHFIRN